MNNQGRGMIDKAGAQEAVEDYTTSLADLTLNSKPLINALTMLAEDYLDFAKAIVNAVDDHLQKVPSNVKLPTLYLIDSIIKNVGKDYIDLFSRSIVDSFCTVFEQVDEKTRQQMYKLRQTWNDIFSEENLYAMDVKVHALDPKWPITAAPTTTSSIAAPFKIHINPKFLQTGTAAAPVQAVAKAISGKVSPALAPKAPVSQKASIATASTVTPAVPAKAATDAEVLREQLLQKKRNLLQLQQEKVDLELSQMKAKLDKKQKAVSKLNEKTAVEVSSVNTTKEKQLLPEVSVHQVVPDHSESGFSMTDEIFMMPEDLIEDTMAIPNPDLQKKDRPYSPSDSPQMLHTSSTTKIAPVSSGLINLVTSQRTQRDPRLLKKPKEENVQDVKKEESKSPGRSRDGNRSSKSEKRSRSSEKEKEFSKTSRRHSRDGSSDRSSRHSSRREDRDKRSSESRKSSRKSDDRSTSRSSKKTSSRSPSKSSSKRDKRGEIRRSPRKTGYTGHRPVSDCVDSSESEVSDSKDRVLSPLSLRSGATSHGSDWAVNYTKGSHKGRNYIRRNLQEESPEVVSSTVSSDTDLRVSAPPEKQIRLSNSAERSLQSSSSALSSGVPEQILPTIACQDVDLRCISSSPGKKRRSAEPEDGLPPNKKNKAAYMEMLFGAQDVDLRQKDINNGIATEVLSPPPPPIISSPDGQSTFKEGHGWSKFKPSPTIERSPAFPRSSRHDRLGRSSGDEELSQAEDTDMRLTANGVGLSSKPDFKAILERADEQFKSGTMSYADYRNVQKQVFRMHESEKIREAQNSDYSRRGTWERRPNLEKDYRHGRSSPETEQFGDIDDRIPAVRPAKKPLLPLPPIPPMHQDGSRHQARHMGQRMPAPIHGPGYVRPHHPFHGPGQRGHPRAIWRHPRMGPGQPFRDNTIALPPVDKFLLERIAQDPMKTITIDNVAREIRFYGEDAVAFLSADNPRAIAFDPGDASIIVNDVVVHCSFHQPAKEVNVGGKLYRVKLGAPTRELYVNDEGFECQFNCPPKDILLATGEILVVQLESEVPPKVHIGPQRRDLVAGRISLVIDAESFFPIFLDAKPQRFDIDGVPHIIKFADALETVLVNNLPFSIKFGGPAVPITVNNTKHYIRLTELPSDVVPGKVEIVSMCHVRTRAPHGISRSTAGAPWSGSSHMKHSVRSPMDVPSPEESSPVEVDHEPALPMHEPALPVRGGLGVMNRVAAKKTVKPKLRRDREPEKSGRVEDRQMPPELFQAIQPGLPSLLGLLPKADNSGYSSTASTSGLFDKLKGVGSASSAASTVMSSVASTSTSSVPTVTTESTAEVSSGSNGIPFLAPDLNIHKLFQSLYDSGILSSISTISDTKKDKTKEEDKKKIHEVDFKDPPSLKVKQPAIIDILYSGIQCSSCGTRFLPEQAEKYSAHLDWHFRQNRRDKDSARKPQSRKWFYDVSDWIQFEEIDDTVDKAQNWFDAQQTETAKFEETEEEEIQSIPSSEFPEGTICQLCHDRFEQFYNEEKEEWHLKDCLVADGLPYHPFCYKDYRVSVDSVEEESKNLAAEDNTTEDEVVLADNVKKEQEESCDEEVVVKEEKMEVDTTAEQMECSTIEDTTDQTIKQEVTEETPDSSTENDSKPLEDESVKPESDVKEEESSDNGPEDMPQATPDSEDSCEPKTLEDVLLRAPLTDTTSAVVSCSIDGNLELAQAPAAPPSVPNRIKINISKPIIVRPSEEADEESKSESGDVVEAPSPSEPAPPGEEAVVLKPKLIGRKLSTLPPKLRGTETSGLCSIM